MNYPIFLTCRDRVTGLQEMVEWLERAGQERIYFIDNASTYAPLLEYFESSPHTRILGTNAHGHRTAWAEGIVDQYAKNEWYVVSDPDIVPDENCPLDVLDFFKEVHDNFYNPPRLKVGFGLRVDDCPDTWLRKEEILPWERHLWSDGVRGGKWREVQLYDAPIDTTFALYRPGMAFTVAPAIRTGFPYVARHVPWYTDTMNPTAEEIYYARHSQRSSTWSDQQLQDWRKHGVRFE